ncbi:MAG: hypothetical protein NWE94_07635 [Candidatus Bathyarchaeota archaeon]|nr:hypothetical protein [Candidatus Bathyarchaeota archaeon]
MQEKPGDASIKRMADLLRQGTTLTELACPVCVSPLFRLKDGTLWCAKCEKKVVIVKEGEEAEKSAGAAMDKLEATLLAKVQEMQSKIEQTEDVDELQKLSAALSELLSNLEKVKKMKKN